MFLNESSIEQINLFAAANDSHHHIASSISSSVAEIIADDQIINQGPEEINKDVVALDSQLEGQDSNVFRISSEVVNAINNVTVDLNRNQVPSCDG